MTSKGRSFSIIGALAAFPRRLIGREVERQGGRLRHGVTRQVTHVVFARGLLSRRSEVEIEELLQRERKAGRQAIGENAFLRMLGLREAPQASDLTRAALLDQSRLAERDFDLLCLFDCFERDTAPFSFRDLILSKKYAGLITGGATWGAVARSIHRASEGVTSLTALSLEGEGRDAIYARLGGLRSELDGQLILPIGRSEEADLEALFEQAEQANAEAHYEAAAALYARCLSIEPTDPDAAFNRANCLVRTGHLDEARRLFLRALKLDPKFVESWFNLANLQQQQGQADSARRHLRQAIAIDADYADAIYNLATLEFSEGNFAEARRWWARYLELDSGSEWARNAAKGVQYVDMLVARKSAS